MWMSRTSISNQPAAALNVSFTHGLGILPQPIPWPAAHQRCLAPRSAGRASSSTNRQTTRRIRGLGKGQSGLFKTKP